jgi:thiamine biosynthesis lipoprotein
MSRNALKNIIYSIILLVTLFFVWQSRQKSEQEGSLFKPENQLEISGSTMGTTYSVKYLSETGTNYRQGVDSLLKVINQSVSTYIWESEISLFNRRKSIGFESPFFLPILKISEEVYSKTDGAFDPTVMPLINAWGFGPGQRQALDSAEVDSLKNLVGFDKVIYNEDSVWKTQQNVQLDFSAIAKGYGVDLVAEFLQSKGIENLMVEIGGEVVCLGKNARGDYWVIGIDNPVRSETGDWIQARVRLKNQAVATSGNYRNFYEENGQLYGHTINPKTGYPIVNELLSASVFAKDCITADAYATSFMVMGLEKAKELLNINPELGAYLIYRENDQLNSFYTENIKELILN